MKNATKRLALCGMLTALATALMLLGTLLPIATYCCPLLASLAVMLARVECGGAWASCVFAVTSVLSLLLAPDKEAAAVFVFLGYYPALKPVVDQVKRKLPRAALKLAVFNLAVCALYTTVLYVFPIRGLSEEFQAFGHWALAVMLLLGNGVFVLYDLVLRQMTALYRTRLQKTVHKFF